MPSVRGLLRPCTWHLARLKDGRPTEITDEDSACCSSDSNTGQYNHNRQYTPAGSTPTGIEDDDCVGCGQVDAQPAGAGGQQERKVSRACRQGRQGRAGREG